MPAQTHSASGGPQPEYHATFWWSDQWLYSSRPAPSALLRRPFELLRLFSSCSLLSVSEFAPASPDSAPAHTRTAPGLASVNTTRCPAGLQPLPVTTAKPLCLVLLTTLNLSSFPAPSCCCCYCCYHLRPGFLSAHPHKARRLTPVSGQKCQACPRLYSRPAPGPDPARRRLVSPCALAKAPSSHCIS